MLKVSGAVRLKRGADRRIAQGYRWVFSNELQPAGVPREPALVELVDDRGVFRGIATYNPRSLIAARIMSFERLDGIGRDFFMQRLEDAVERRRRLGYDTRFCRIVYGESDSVPGLVVDRYGAVFAVQYFSAGMQALSSSVVEALAAVFDPEVVVARNDFALRAYEGLDEHRAVLLTRAGGVPDTTITIEHLAERYVVDVMSGQKTGFYYDQRENRRHFSALTAGRRVLDLCSYTGSFGVTGARAGATEVVCVDASAQALSVARENARLNRTECVLVQADVDEYLTEALTRSERFDVVMFDPPSYAHARKDLPRAVRKYVQNCRDIVRCLNPGGVLCVAVCSYHVGWDDMRTIVAQALAKAGRDGYIVHYGIQAADHPILAAMRETEYLKFLTVGVR